MNDKSFHENTQARSERDFDKYDYKSSFLLSNLRFKIDGQKSITGGGDDKGCERKPHCWDREHSAHRDLGKRLSGLNLRCFHLVLLLPVLVAEMLISVDVDIFFIL